MTMSSFVFIPILTWICDPSAKVGGHDPCFVSDSYVVFETPRTFLRRWQGGFSTTVREDSGHEDQKGCRQERRTGEGKQRNDLKKD